MNTDEKEKARRLYFQSHLTSTEIADALAMPHHALHCMIKEQNWEYQKQCAAHMPVMIAENCYHILANYTQQLLAPERKDVMISLKEVNTLHKLTVTIANLKSRTTLNENMEVFTNFMGAVSVTSPEMAKAIAPFVNDFIASGARISTSVPQNQVKKYTAAEEEEEARLDRQYAAEANATAPCPVSIPRRPVTIPDTAAQAAQAAARRKSPPPYTEFIAELHRQNENIRHLFTVTTRNPFAVAA